MLIDISYFTGEINIPNTDKRVNSYNADIARYEKEILLSLLGYELYTDFIAGLAAPDPIDQKWLNLRDGVEYDFEYRGNTIKMKWGGLINADKISLIAYYCYYKIRKRDVSLTTSVNEVRGKLENSETVNETRKIINSYRLMLDLYGETECAENGFNYTRDQTEYFDKYMAEYDTYNDVSSAFNFLNTHRADYPGWRFSPLNNLNEFGI